MLILSDAKHCLFETFLLAGVVRKMHIVMNSPDPAIFREIHAGGNGGEQP